MISYQIKLDSDVLPSAPLDRKTLLQAQAKGVEVLLKGHFRARQAEGNKKRWPLPPFWFGVRNTMASATAVGEVTEQSAEVVIADGRMNQKVFGGTIRPKRAKNLVIPLTAAAARMGAMEGSLSDRTDLALIVTGKGAYLAQESYEARGSKGRRKGKQPAGIQRQRLTFLFKLVKSVQQSKDPRALPLAATFEANLKGTADKIMPRLMRRRSGNGGNTGGTNA